jgi:putative oxidoreductase
VSTGDDRPRYPGGYSDSGSHLTGGSGYARGGTRSYPVPSVGGYGGGDDEFDDAGYSSAPTTYATETGLEEEEFEFEKPGWHASADFGLLVLRLVIGGAFILHGLQKLFGLFNGPGINNFAEALGQLGFNQTTLLAWVTGVSELGGGVLLVVGLFTPIGAAAILGVMANVIILKVTGGAGFFTSQAGGSGLAKAGGIELEVALAGAALALMFIGPGRVSIDRPTPWYRHPGAFAFAALILAVAATAVTLAVFR